MSAAMTEHERKVLVAQLWATRAAVDAALTVLGEGEADETEDATNDGCAHPAEQREDMTEMGGPLEWRCRGCGFHSKEDQTMKPEG